MVFFDVIDGLLTVLATGSVALGLFVAYNAYRGLQRHQDRRMLFLSVGLVLLFGVSYALAFAMTLVLEFTVVPLLYQEVLRLLVRGFQFAGLLCIAYSMYVE
jgi:hypothetical protein